MKRVRWKENQGVALNAKTELPKLAEIFYVEGRNLLAAQPTAETLHPFRLRAKALRYTLELFRPFYGPGLEARLASLRWIQDTLGAISDYATTLKWIHQRLPESSTTRVRLDGLLRARMNRRVAEFRRFWTRSFDAPGELDRWKRYLARPRSPA